MNSASVKEITIWNPRAPDPNTLTERSRPA